MAIELSEKQKKDGWQVVRFDEIARNISERVEPSATDLEIYVGLEHLDPQSLRITRYGVPSDVSGQKLRVRPGQIIFGKRRAYQKKLAVADFDGICSAHAMVLEALPGKIIPELLPFLMQSDMFMDRAVAISEGSLSPTIKWKALAMQKFSLPPLVRQKEILEVLEKVEETRQNTLKLVDSAKRVSRSLINDHILKLRSLEVQPVRLGAIGQWRGGGTPSKGKREYWINGSIHWMSPKDMFSGRIAETEDFITEEALMGSSANLIEAGSILMVTRSGVLRHTLPIGILAVPMAINQDIKALTVSSKYNPDYIWYVLLFYANKILKDCSKVGTTVESIDFILLKNFKLLVPKKKDQDKFANIMRCQSRVLSELEHNYRSVCATRNGVFAQLFKGGDCED